MNNLIINWCEIINIPIIDSWEKWILWYMELFNHIPFEIKRIYFINRIINSNIERWFHAHKNLDQVLFCIDWKVELLLDDWNNIQTITLDSPNVWVKISGMVWREMRKFCFNTNILVLASEFYDESDYIRSYDEFLKYLK